MPSDKVYTMREMWVEIKRDALKNAIISAVLIIACLILGHYIPWVDEHFWMALGGMSLLLFGVDQLIKLVPDDDLSQEKYPSTPTSW